MPDELQHDCTGSTHTCTNLYCLLSMLIPKINSAGWGWGCFRSLIRRREGRCPNEATNDVIIEFASIQDRGER